MSTEPLDLRSSPFLPGSWVLHGRDVWRFLALTPAGQARIHCLSQPEPQEVEIQTLRPLQFANFQLDRVKPFESYPIVRQQQALRRRQVITELMSAEWNQAALKEAAGQLGVSITTLLRYANRYLISGCRIEALVPRVLRFGIGNHRLPKSVEEVIQDAIKVYYLSPERIPIRGIVRAIQRTCRERHIKAPCAESIRQRIRNVPPDEAALHRLGLKTVREIYKALPGRAPEGDGPLAMIEIDHTPVNLLCRLPNGRVLRPWITMAIDAFTRMVLGFYLSFDPPSRLSVGMCLFRVLSPKEEWLRRHGITASWPCWGRPRIIQVDNAREFRSYDMDRICLELDIVLQWRPVGVPEYGGRIERLMGAAAHAAEFLPGKTFRSITERGDYPAEKMAILDLPTLERAFLHYFVEVYNHQSHRGLRNRSPIHEWRTAVAQSPLDLQSHSPSDNHQLLSVLPTFERTIQQDGVSWETLRYFDPMLARYIRRPNPESPNGSHRFAFDPRDIRFIYWREPRKRTWHRIQARDLGMQSLSIWERDTLLEQDRDEARKTIDVDVVARGEASLAEIADQQKKLSLAAHRERKRKAKAERQPKQSSLPPGPPKAMGSATSLVADLQPRPVDSPEPDPSIWADIPEFQGRSL